MLVMWSIMHQFLTPATGFVVKAGPCCIKQLYSPSSWLQSSHVQTKFWAQEYQLQSRIDSFKSAEN
uniref:Uncharacterized protein n=1 Tax=Rhizophora mucronata TaxID=61149 RepID=A0A2P2IJU4_RHIMU